MWLWFGLCAGFKVIGCHGVRVTGWESNAVLVVVVWVLCGCHGDRVSGLWILKEGFPIV